MLSTFRRANMRRLCGALAMPALAAACHRYVPVTGTAPVGVRVATRLTDRGTVEMARWVGPGAEVIEGEVLAANDSVLTVAVSRVQQRNGIESYWAGERVTIDRSYAASVEERQVSRPRTTMAAAGFGVIISAIAAAFVLGHDNGSSGGSGGGTGGK
jgi:hypothetical protein